MKRVLFLFAVVLLATSCKKWKDGKKHGEYTYYSEDYKEADMSVLGIHTSEIDALWIELYDTNKDKEVDGYSLLVKSNGEVVKENGTIVTDWKTTITFNPSSADAYAGTWLGDKDKFSISYDLETRVEELTFIYKETCKK